ncbi:hypothetical protein HK104_005586, partial [Borealophlyctis nickersoniae]
MNVNQVPPELIAKVLAYLPIFTLIDLPEVSKYFNLVTRRFLITHFLRNLHVHLSLLPDPHLVETDHDYEFDYIDALVQHVIPKLKAVCPVAVEATRQVKREILEENREDLKKLMKEKGMVDEEAFLDSLNEQDTLLGTGEDGLPSVNYYKEYLIITGYACEMEPTEKIIWTMYPRMDGDFVVFQCLNAVVPFGFGAKDVTLAINACVEPRGSDGACRWHSFNLFSAKSVKLVGSAVEENEVPEGKEGGRDGGRGVGDDDGCGRGDKDEEDESKTFAVGNDGIATLEGDGFSITCQVKRNVCTTYSFTVSEISVPTIKIPLPQFYSLCIKRLRAMRKKRAEIQEQLRLLEEERERLEARRPKWDTVALPMLAP